MQQSATLKDNPLEHNLGFFDFGRYHKAVDGSKHAFEKIGELMGFEIDSDGEDSKEDDDDGSGNDHGVVPTQKKKPECLLRLP